MDDRPIYGAALIESWGRLAEFYQGTKGDKSDEVAQQQGRLRCLDQAVQIGRRLSKKFPDDVDLHYQLASALYSRAVYDNGADRNKEAYEFFADCIETFRTRVCRQRSKPTEYQLGRFLTWIDSAQQCAEKLKRADEVMRLADLAYELGKDCTDREGIQPRDSSVSFRRSAQGSRPF